MSCQLIRELLGVTKGMLTNDIWPEKKYILFNVVFRSFRRIVSDAVPVGNHAGRLLVQRGLSCVLPGGLSPCCFRSHDDQLRVARYELTGVYDRRCRASVDGCRGAVVRRASLEWREVGVGK